MLLAPRYFSSFVLVPVKKVSQGVLTNLDFYGIGQKFPIEKTSKVSCLPDKPALRGFFFGCRSCRSATGKL